MELGIERLTDAGHGLEAELRQDVEELCLDLEQGRGVGRVRRRVALGQLQGVEDREQAGDDVAGLPGRRLLGLADGSLLVVLEVRLDSMCHGTQLVALLGQEAELVEVLLDELCGLGLLDDLSRLFDDLLVVELLAHDSSTISASTTSSSFTSWAAEAVAPPS